MPTPHSPLPGLAELAALACRPQSSVLDAAECERLLAQLPGWQIAGSELAKTFGFADYHRTIAFVNALAWVAHRQDHHPDLSVHFNRCRVAWSTHSAGGLTLNDFICAARTESLTA